MPPSAAGKPTAAERAAVGFARTYEGRYVDVPWSGWGTKWAGRGSALGRVHSVYRDTVVKFEIRF